MREDIVKRLASLGYAFNVDVDGWVIGFLIDKVESFIKSEINILEIPEGLYEVAVDMACGEFLKAKKASGDLGGFVVDLNSAALKQKSQGDTSFTFAVDKIESAEERLDGVINHLLNYGKPQFASFRRFSW